MSRSRRSGQRLHFFTTFFRSRLTLVVGLALIAVIGFSLVREINNRRALSRERQALENEIAALEGRNTELSQLLERLKSTDYAEEEARLKLGLQKPGEKVVRIVGRSVAGADGTNAEGDESSAQLTVPLRWWNYFFNH